MSLKRDFAEAFQTPSELLRAATERAVADLGDDAPSFLSSLPLHVSVAGNVVEGSAFIWRMACESADITYEENVFLPFARREDIDPCVAFAYAERWQIQTCVHGMVNTSARVADSASLADFIPTIATEIGDVEALKDRKMISMLLSGPSFPHTTGMIVANFRDDRDCHWLRDFSPHVLIVPVRQMRDETLATRALLFTMLLDSTRYRLQRVASLLVLREKVRGPAIDVALRTVGEHQMLSNDRYIAGSPFEYDYVMSVVLQSVIETQPARPWEPFGGMAQAFAFFSLVGHRRALPRLGIERRYPDAPRFLSMPSIRAASGQEGDVPQRDLATSFFRLHSTAFTAQMHDHMDWVQTIGRLAIQFGRWQLFHEACLLAQTAYGRAFLSWLLPSCVSTLTLWAAFPLDDITAFGVMHETHRQWLRENRLPVTKGTWMRHVGPAMEALFLYALRDFRAMHRQKVLRFAEAVLRLPEADASRSITPRAFSRNMIGDMSFSMAHPFVCPDRPNELRPFPAYRSDRPNAGEAHIGMVIRVQPDIVRFWVSPHHIDLANPMIIAAFAAPYERERLFDAEVASRLTRFVVISREQYDYLAGRLRGGNEQRYTTWIVCEDVEPREAVARVLMIINSVRMSSGAFPFFVVTPLLAQPRFVLHLGTTRQELDLIGVTRFMTAFLRIYLNNVAEEIVARFDIMRQQFISKYSTIMGPTLGPALFRLFSHGSGSNSAEVVQCALSVLQDPSVPLLPATADIRLLVNELARVTAPLFHRLTFAGKRAADMPPAPMDYINFEPDAERSDIEICNVYVRETTPAKNIRVHFLSIE